MTRADGPRGGVLVAEEFDPSTPTNDAITSTTSIRRRRRASLINRIFGCFCLPTRVAVNCCTFPCVRAVRGRKRPSWNKKTELAISTLRSAAATVTRDTQSLRFWTDRAIPDIVLPRDAVRQKMRLKFRKTDGEYELKVEWVWYRKLSPPDLVSSPHDGNSKSVKNFLTHEIIQNWNCPIVLYLHGGAFCLCSSSTHRALLYSMAIAGQMALFVPNYRRPPEVSVKEAVDDCFQAYMYLIRDVGIDAKKIILMGDSAGGALVGLVLCRIRDAMGPTVPAAAATSPTSDLLPSAPHSQHGVISPSQGMMVDGSSPSGSDVVVGTPLPMPRCGVMMSPWVNLNDEGIGKSAASGIIMPEYDYLPFDAIVLFANESIGDHDICDPQVNISYADLTGLPPLYINYGEVEILRPQIEKFIDKCRTSNIEVETNMLTDMIHVGQMLSTVTLVGAQENIRIAQYIHKQVAAL